MLSPTLDKLKVMFWLIGGLFRSHASLEAENAVLRHQINILRRQFPKKPAFINFDRLIFAVLYRWIPRTLDGLVIVQPETVVRWHRAGFRAFWRRKSRHRVGRPSVPHEHLSPNT